MKESGIAVVLVVLVLYLCILVRSEQPSKFCIAEANTPPMCYYSFVGFHTFAEAELMCSRISSKVLLPRREVENDVISALLLSQGDLNMWLGAVEVAYKWKDISQDTSEWDDEVIGERYKACVSLSSLRWKQSFCLERQGYMCEFSSEKCTGLKHAFTSNNICYVIYDVTVTWFEAKQNCAEQGGALFRPTPAAIGEMDDPGFDLWIDVTNHAWLDWSGKELDYFNWADNQPNSKDQKCSMLLDDGKWFDRKCSEKHKVICQRKCVSGTNGISSCVELPDGDYASCVSCEMYASCVNGEMIDQRICATDGNGKRTVWNEAEKRCDFDSDFCQVGVNVTITTTTSTTTSSTLTSTSMTSVHSTLMTSPIVDTTKPATIADDVTAQNNSATVDDVSYEFPLIGKRIR
ncbi:hypothetical protein CAPTEDRAFT_209071 [Capitella teleta]|uniref:C-type lectin domain-containing protein n=1 Tax=Capitella teleta TaxID=283909 RepID=R7VG94_CAPTE|nr:hypothetical protein CAPTEDRAFT_209071 [Capitella teleta]|eukprot:ELU17639.1 hypothetical protein CAPTEDRAFT_209071 [Capitella teleta]